MRWHVEVYRNLGFDMYIVLECVYAYEMRWLFSKAPTMFTFCFLGNG